MALSLTTSSIGLVNSTGPTASLTDEDKVCVVYFAGPAYVTWSPHSDYPVVGTTYLFVDADKNTTSTSVTCTPSIVDEQRSKGTTLGLPYGMQATMDENCNVYAPYFDAEGRGQQVATATWPGREWYLDLGTKVQFASMGRPEWTTFLPPNQSYTYNDITPGSYARQYTLPHLSLMYPNITDFRTCTRASFQTAPNSLNYAPFLTEIKTLPRTAEGSLTIPSQSRTADPGVKPTPEQPSPTQVGLPAQPGQTGNNADSQILSRPDLQPSSPANPAQPDSDGVLGSVSSSGQGSPANQGSSPNQGNGASQDSSLNPGNPTNPGIPPTQGSPTGLAQQTNGASNQQGTKQTTKLALALPDAHILQEGSPPATVDGRLIFLDKGTVHVAPTSTPGQAPNAAQATALSLEQMSNQGGMEVAGSWLPLKDTTVIVSDAGNTAAGTGSAGALANTATGTSSGSMAGGPAGGSAGDSVGKRISDFGTWIMSGLGASTGASGSGKGGGSTGQSGSDISSQGGAGGASISGQNGGTGRNSTVVPFTGDATHVGTGLSALAIFVGVAVVVL